MFLISINIIIQLLFSMNINGTVVDQYDYEIVGAKVYNNIDTVYTNFDGSFCLEADSNTKYIHIEMISFYDQVYKLSEIDNINIKLYSK